ncbi:MAG: hypothetical protein F6J98_01620 [Moorea sp. SIO4G2]|nr:hypothetical protein [Moorena sp. SIO4G2]
MIDLEKVIKGSINFECHKFSFVNTSQYFYEIRIDKGKEWSNDKKSKIIEMAYFSVPPPPIIIWEPLSKVDFKQRRDRDLRLLAGHNVAKTIHDFEAYNLTLSGLEHAPHLNGADLSYFGGFEGQFSQREIVPVYLGKTGWFMQPKQINEMAKQLRSYYDLYYL